jgi:hypothetical protein
MSAPFHHLSHRRRRCSWARRSAASAARRSFRAACAAVSASIRRRRVSPPRQGHPGPTTRSGLRTGLQGGRIDQAGRYGLVAGFLVLGALGVPGGGIGEAGAHVGHQVAQGAEAGEDALDVGVEVGEEAVRLGGVGGTARPAAEGGGSGACRTRQGRTCRRGS